MKQLTFQIGLSVNFSSALFYPAERMKFIKNIGLHDKVYYFHRMKFENVDELNQWMSELQDWLVVSVNDDGLTDWLTTSISHIAKRMKAFIDFAKYDISYKPSMCYYMTDPQGDVSTFDIAIEPTIELD